MWLLAASGKWTSVVVVRVHCEWFPKTECLCGEASTFLFVFLLRYRLGVPDADTNRIDRGVDREDWDVGRCEVWKRDRDKSYYVGSWDLGVVAIGEQRARDLIDLALLARWSSSIYSNVTIGHRVLLRGALSCCILL